MFIAFCTHYSCIHIVGNKLDNLIRALYYILGEVDKLSKQRQNQKHAQEHMVHQSYRGLTGRRKTRSRLQEMARNKKQRVSRSRSRSKSREEETRESPEGDIDSQDKKTVVATTQTQSLRDPEI